MFVNVIYEYFLFVPIVSLSLSLSLSSDPTAQTWVKGPPLFFFLSSSSNTTQELKCRSITVYLTKEAVFKRAGHNTGVIIGEQKLVNYKM